MEGVPALWVPLRGASRLQVRPQRPNDQPPADVTLAGLMLVVILRREGIVGVRDDLVTATLASIDPGNFGRSSWLMDLVELVRAHLRDVFGVFVPSHDVTLLGDFVSRDTLNECAANQDYHLAWLATSALSVQNERYVPGG
jgi:hypothetical protein